jgi:hypothetical protein
VQRSKESFARFFEDPSREGLRELLKQHVGETRFMDFKEEWPKHVSLAKQILGFANTGNACLIMGGKEEADGTIEAIGLPKLEDKADITNGLKKYLPPELLQRTDVLDFSFDASEYPKVIGKRFQVVLIEYDVDHTPVLALRDGDGLKSSAIYVRREGQTEEATHDEIQSIINKRIDTRYSTSKEINLKQHLEQLRALYGEIPRSSKPLFALGTFAAAFFHPEPNANGETYEEFVNRMIDLKKAIIARAIGATPELQKAHQMVYNRARPVKAKDIV